MSSTTSTDPQSALDKKLSDIAAKEQGRTSQALAQELDLPFADLAGLPIDPEALAQIPESTSRSCGIALLQIQGATAVVAVLDPRPENTQEQIQELKKRYPTLSIIIVSPTTMDVVWARYETIKTTTSAESGAVNVDDALLKQTQEQIKNLTDLKNHLGDVTVTHLFEILLAGALAIGASDIHFEPEDAVVRLRYRLDGLLQDVTSVEKAQYHRVLNRVKALAHLKFNITKAPQDGRFTIHQDKVDIEVRVSILPSEYGESIVMRLLDPRSIHAQLEDLGMRADVLAQVKELLAKPQGTLLTTGPTGAGKTTTLYAFLNHLNTPDMKIITVEDPIEYHIQGVNQTQVEPDKGYTFADGLRSIVRQDPDIILIGEIRDHETAEIALQAALTGHMVLSTIHTNDAAGTIPRLIDIGAKPETVAPALTMAMGQRLLRRLCPACKKPFALTPKDAAKLQAEISPIAQRFSLSPIDEKTAVYGPVGCAQCNNLGYKGRVGVYEVFAVSREMERLILSSASASDVRDLAVKEGMVTMLQDGYLKLIEGTTSIDEIHRVLG